MIAMVTFTCVLHATISIADRYLAEQIFSLLHFILYKPPLFYHYRVHNYIPNERCHSHSDSHLLQQKQVDKCHHFHMGWCNKRSLHGK